MSIMGWIRNLRIRQLRMLLRLCETKNLSQVAQEFSLTQPALSKWLKEFEKTIGSPLFSRHSKGLHPTPLMLELARQSQDILIRLERTQQSINQIKTVAHSQISIGLSPIVAHTSLPSAITSFHAKNPKTFIKFHEDTFNQLLAKLRAGEVDLVIARTEKGASLHDLCQHALAEIQLCLIVDRRHPLANEPEVSWKQAMSYPWIAPPAGSPVRQQMEIVFTKLGVGAPPVLIESTSISLTVRLLENTTYIAPIASKSLEPLGLSHSLNVPCLQGELNASIALIWSPEHNEYELLQQLIGHVKAAY